MLDTENTKVLSWKREAAGSPPLVVALNFTAEPQTVNLVGPGLPDGSSQHVIEATYPARHSPGLAQEHSA